MDMEGGDGDDSRAVGPSSSSDWLIVDTLSCMIVYVGYSLIVLLCYIYYNEITRSLTSSCACGDALLTVDATGSLSVDMSSSSSDMGSEAVEHYFKPHHNYIATCMKIIIINKNHL